MDNALCTLERSIEKRAGSEIIPIDRTNVSGDDPTGQRFLFTAGFAASQFSITSDSASDIFNDAEIIVKVKEPQKVEVDMIRENQIVYTYLHLAAAKELTEGLIKSKSINIAYETVTDDNGR